MHSFHAFITFLRAVFLNGVRKCFFNQRIIILYYFSETTKKKSSSTPKREDKKTTPLTTNSKSTVIAITNISTIEPQKTNHVHESSTPANCTTGDRVKKALTNSGEWNGNLVVIVIPLVCFLLVVLLIVDIVYRCR